VCGEGHGDDGAERCDGGHAAEWVLGVVGEVGASLMTVRL
jgi:hypothetical protein